MTSSTHHPPLDCADVDARLAEYLDDEPPVSLADADRAAVDRHVATCARCRALVRDLRAVSAAAASLPALAPSRDLWADIAPRLAPRTAAGAPAADDATPARVLPFEVRHLRHAPPPARRRGAAPVAWSRRALAAAAVALMAVSAGTTYLFTRGGGTPDAPRAHVAAAQPAATGTPAAGTRTTDAPTTGARTTGAQTADPAVARASDESDRSTGSPPADARARLARGGGDRSGAARFAARPVDPAADVPAVAAYDREIAALRAVVRERRGELDSTTVNVLVRNLGIIDAAIAQSRAALARDPQSQFLGDQLSRALGQKVELLRTVALMPRT